MPPQPIGDRRVEKTRKALHEALILLLHEKSYEDIAVKEILDGANVGRSTFYTHFRDKDDLLVSGMLEMLRSVERTEPPSPAAGPDRFIRFSLSIFEHIAEQRRAGRLRIGSRGRAILHEHLQKVLILQISGQIKSDPEARRRIPERIPMDLLVQHLASTFVLVLNWWVDGKRTVSAKQADELFRSLILPALADPSKPM